MLLGLYLFYNAALDLVGQLALIMVDFLRSGHCSVTRCLPARQLLEDPHGKKIWRLIIYDTCGQGQMQLHIDLK